MDRSKRSINHCQLDGCECATGALALGCSALSLSPRLLRSCEAVDDDDDIRWSRDWICGTSNNALIFEKNILIDGSVEAAVSYICHPPLHHSDV